MSPLPGRLASEWAYDLNGSLTPETFPRKSQRQLHWRCPDCRHEWSASFPQRLAGESCPHCCNSPATPTTALAVIESAAASYWDREGNPPTLTPTTVRYDSPLTVRWQCRHNDSHRWDARVIDHVQQVHAGHPCPICTKGWDASTLRLFLQSLLPHLTALSAAERYTIFQQAGILMGRNPTSTLARTIATHPNPESALRNVLSGDQPLSALAPLLHSSLSPALPDFSVDPDPTDPTDPTPEALPTVSTRALFEQHRDVPLAMSDSRAARFLIRSGANKLWERAYAHPDATLAEVQASLTPSTYLDEIRTLFLNEYRAALDLPLPRDYAFTLKGTPTAPNLFQRVVASRLLQERRLLNLGGIGVGKTLAVILASRVVDAPITIVACPNGTIDQTWIPAIQAAFPRAAIATKTFEPQWTPHAPYCYLLLNYEMFQQPDTLSRIDRFITRYPEIGHFSIDELHQTKVRHEKLLSLRRQHIEHFVHRASYAQPRLTILGSTATPVVNTLQEARSLLELVAGHPLPDLDTQNTIPNAIAIHQELILRGVRCPAQLKVVCRRHHVIADCTPWIRTILALPEDAGTLRLEQILTEARLTKLTELLQPQTIIYSLYVDTILDQVEALCTQHGWSVGRYTGNEKEGLQQFLNKEVQILLVSNVANAGIDGLQYICHRMLIVTTPWTDVELSQVIGRVARQGQPEPAVDIYFLITTGTYRNTSWSWDLSKLDRLKQKQSLADAVINGTIPHSTSQESQQSQRHLLSWLQRLQHTDTETDQPIEES